MKRILLAVLVCFISSLTVIAQELKVDAITYQSRDSEAVLDPVYDGNGELCAVLMVYAPGISNLQFAGSYVIQKKYNGVCYILHVATGIIKMEIKHANYLSVRLNFRERRVRIEGGKTYRMDVSISQAEKEVVFHMLPRQGFITVSGEKHAIENGFLQLNLTKGKYPYLATAENYHEEQGSVEITGLEDAPKIVPVKLKPHLISVNFQCNTTKAELYVDNKYLGNPGTYTLPVGMHNLRVKAKNWQNYIKTIYVSEKTINTYNIQMEPNSVISVRVRIIGDTSATLYIDNKLVSGWRNGGYVRIKPGKHLFTAISSSNSRGKSVVARVRPEMEPVVIKYYH